MFVLCLMQNKISKEHGAHWKTCRPPGGTPAPFSSACRGGGAPKKRRRVRGGGRPQRKKACPQKKGGMFSLLLTRGGAESSAQSETCINSPIRDEVEKQGEADRKLSK